MGGKPGLKIKLKLKVGPLVCCYARGARTVHATAHGTKGRVVQR